MSSSRRPNPVSSRLLWIAKNYKDPMALYWATKAAIELVGAHQISLPPPSQLRPGWETRLVDTIRKNAKRLGRHRYERYLPWVAQQVAAVRRRGEYMQANQVGQRLTRALRSIGEWAQAEHIDLRQVPAEDAIRHAAEWVRQQKLESLPQGRVVVAFSDGFTAQELTTPEELEAEGDAMRHCVGSYAEEVAAGKSAIYSIRDPNGNPHVTIEIEPSSNEVVQIRGKKDEDPVEIYWPYVGGLLEHLGVRKSYVPQSVLDGVKEAYMEVESVRSDAAEWAGLLEEVPGLILEGKLKEAVDRIREASGLEGEYGADPRTTKFMDVLIDVVAEIVLSAEHALASLPARIRDSERGELVDSILSDLRESVAKRQGGYELDTTWGLPSLWAKASGPAFLPVRRAIAQSAAAGAKRLEEDAEQAKDDWHDMDWTGEVQIIQEPAGLEDISIFAFDADTFTALPHETEEDMIRRVAADFGHIDNPEIAQYISAWESSPLSRAANRGTADARRNSKQRTVPVGSPQTKQPPNRLAGLRRRLLR